MKANPPQGTATPPNGPPANTALIVDSQTLLQGQNCLHIRHLGELYRLQLTRQGKLILTK